MRWLAIDPGAKTGVAVFRGGLVERVLTVRAKGAKGAWCHDYGERVIAYRDEAAAWGELVAWSWAEGVVVEVGYVGHPRASLAVAERRGVILGHLAARGVPCLARMNAAEWRRVIGERRGVSWPRDRERAKALARELAGVEREDEADAVLLGEAYLATGGITTATALGVEA